MACRICLYFDSRNTDTKLMFSLENQVILLSCLPDDNGNARSIHAVMFKYTSWTLCQ